MAQKLSSAGDDAKEEAPFGISQEAQASMKKAFLEDPVAVLAARVLQSSGRENVVRNRGELFKTTHKFSNKIPIEGSPVTSQKSSGRCWLFAALNLLRVGVMKQFKLKEFEFSQAFLFFFDKLERCNYFLDCILRTLDQPLDGRLVQYLLKTPVNDGGQWDMLVNVIEKYGLLPKYAWPDGHSCTASREMNLLVTQKLRSFAFELRKEAGASPAKLQAIKKNQMEILYRLIASHLGVPPTTFTWRPKHKHERIEMTPLEFAKDVVKQRLGNYVSLIHDPRNEYYKLYTVQYLGNMEGAPGVRYINLPIEELKKQVREAVVARKEPVWFGCDFGSVHGVDRSKGIMSTSIFDFESVFKTKATDLDKADRLRYRSSLMTHAMLITGVDIVGGVKKPNRAQASQEAEVEKKEGTELTGNSGVLDKERLEEEDPDELNASIEGGNVVAYRVENSHGKDRGKDGYHQMSDSFFEEFLYQIAIDRKFLDAKIVKVLEQKPIELPPWDPMGALAR